MVNLTFRAKALLLVLVEFVRKEGRAPLQRELLQAGAPDEGVRGDVGLMSQWYMRTGAVNQHPFGLTHPVPLNDAAKELANAGLLTPRVKRYRKNDAEKVAALKRVQQLERKVKLDDKETQELDLLKKGLQDNAGSAYLPTEAGFRYADEHLSGSWETW